jgi:hypothetical protein
LNAANNLIQFKIMCYYINMDNMVCRGIVISRYIDGDNYFVKMQDHDDKNSKFNSDFILFDCIFKIG